jgi:hypothetical protein
MLSGIGPGEHLRSLGIEVRHDLPGVGRNLHDHLDAIAVLDAPRLTDLFGLSLKGAVNIVRGVFEWRRRRTGILTTNFAEAGGFFRSDPGVDRPDMQFHFDFVSLEPFFPPSSLQRYHYHLQRPPLLPLPLSPIHCPLTRCRATALFDPHQIPLDLPVSGRRPIGCARPIKAKHFATHPPPRARALPAHRRSASLARYSVRSRSDRCSRQIEALHPRPNARQTIYHRSARFGLGLGTGQPLATSCVTPSWAQWRGNDGCRVASTLDHAESHEFQRQQPNAPRS